MLRGEPGKRPESFAASSELASKKNLKNHPESLPINSEKNHTFLRENHSGKGKSMLFRSAFSSITCSTRAEEDMGSHHAPCRRRHFWPVIVTANARFSRIPK